MTARDMVTQAMRELTVIASGENPTADEIADGIFRLNSMLKAWGVRVALWRDTPGVVAFPAGTASAVLTPRPGRVTSARYRLDTTNERPLTRWEPADYDLLPNKASRGSPTAYIITQNPAAVTMTLWPVPSVVTTVLYSYDRVVEDVTSANDVVDVPQMFFETVWTNLAVRLAPMFGKARLDPQTLAEVKGRAARLEAEMLDWDRPDSYQLGPDLDGYP